MPIVLAIEPDRRQAAHLAAIVRHQVGAELLIADTTEGALDAIGNRVPDLVLVPALLSPQDDAALAAALRVIAAAAHVRTLTIPALASGIKRAPAGGMLAKWRKGRAASPEPDGCDPAVFGEQISTYLQEAAAARAELDEDLLLEDPPAVVVVQPPAAVEQPRDAAIELSEPEPVQPWAAAPFERAVIDHEATAIDHEGTAIDLKESLIDEEPLIDLSEELAELSGDADGELFDGERVGVYTISAEADEPDIDAFDLLPAILEPPPVARPIAAAADAVPLAAAERSPVVAHELLPVEPAELPRADIEPWVPMSLTPGRMWPALEGMPAEMPVARTEQPDWIELVASLRQDLERRRTEPASATADPIAARPSDGARADTHRLVKKPRAQAKKTKPVQDEWGFFDPEQCGFSTLLAKLDEITDEGAGL